MSEDRFERQLRVVLAEDVPTEAPEPVRARLSAVAANADAAGSRPETQPRRAFGRLGPIFAVLGSFAAVGVAIAIAVALAGSRPTQVGGPGATSPDEPGVSPAVAPEIVWDSGVVRLTANDVELVAGGREFLVAPHAMEIHSDPGDEGYQTLEVTWQEHGVEMRVYLYFGADGRSWTLDELRTYNGQDQGDWITYPGPLLRAPLGQPFMGGFERADPRAQGRIRFDGLSLFPFRPGAVRAGPTNCAPAAPPAPADGGPIGGPAGGPDLGVDLRSMTPQEAGAWLAERGLCVSWRFEHETAPGGGYSEYWCSPPPGRITEITTDDDGSLIVFVSPVDDVIRPERPQPPAGWGC